MRLVLFLILTIEALNAKAQTLSETFSFANTLFAQESYQNSIAAYKRVLFFDTTNSFNSMVYPRMAKCFFKTQQYQEAANYFEMAYFSEQSSDIKNEYLLQKISCFLILKQFEFAEIELLNLTPPLNESQNKEVAFFNGIISFAHADFLASEGFFKNIIPDSSLVEQLFVKNKKIDKKSPRKAKILSMILPGLGQFYVGDYKNGANSILLTGGLMALGLRSAVRNSPLDAAISFIPWFQRYYQGGFNKAEQIAKSKIEEKRFAIYNLLLDEYEKSR
jgi:tetratricopeptide (TPR) repeat protein